MAQTETLTKQCMYILLDCSGQSGESCSLQVLQADEGWQAADLPSLSSAILSPSSLVLLHCLSSSFLPSQLSTSHPTFSSFSNKYYLLSILTSVFRQSVCSIILSSLALLSSTSITASFILYYVTQIPQFNFGPQIIQLWVSQILPGSHPAWCQRVLWSSGRPQEHMF